MDIRFREVDPFNCWLWIRFSEPPSQGERNYVDGVFDSWYVIGRLGGFNAENLQVHDAGSDLSWMTYDNDGAESAMPALMHNMGQLEYQNDWGRCWVDLGTSDGVAIDVLINALRQLDSDVVQIEELVVGGVNENWPVEDPSRQCFPCRWLNAGACFCRRIAWIRVDRFCSTPMSSTTCGECCACAVASRWISPMVAAGSRRQPWWKPSCSSSIGQRN